MKKLLFFTLVTLFSVQAFAEWKYLHGKDWCYEVGTNNKINDAKRCAELVGAAAGLTVGGPKVLTKSSTRKTELPQSRSGGRK